MRLMCRVLGVSRAGFYAAQRRARSARALRDQGLGLKVREVHRRSRRRYGAPRVHAEVQAQGERVGRKRIARLMREEGLVGRRPRRFVRTTDSRHANPIAPNVLERQFGVEEVAGPNRVCQAFRSIRADAEFCRRDHRPEGLPSREVRELDKAVVAAHDSLADGRIIPWAPNRAVKLTSALQG